MRSRTFERLGDFAAIGAAEAWLTRHGISYGSMQRDAPIAVMVGDYTIAKWHNLTLAEQASAHGVITGEMRHGPVTVTFRDHCPCTPPDVTP